MPEVSNDDTEPASPGRKRLVALKRKASFQEMDGLAERVAAWFDSSELAACVDAFCKPHVEDFVVDAVGGERDSRGQQGWQVFGTGGSRSSGAAALHRKRLYHQFETVFEEALQKLLAACDVTYDQFLGIVKLSDAEERLYGLHFYRWLEASSYTAFVRVMTSYHAQRAATPAALLRAHVRSLSTAARYSHAQQKLVLPILDKWDAPSFAEIVQCLEDPSCPVPSRSVAQRKALARWRNRILSPVVDAAGVHHTPEVDREQWSRYVTHYAAPCTDVFHRLIDYLRRHVDTLPLGPPLGERAQRRAVYNAFHSLDTHSNRRVELQKVQKVLGSVGMCQSVQEQKCAAKHAALLRNAADTHPSMPLTLCLSDFRNLLGDMAAAAQDGGTPILSRAGLPDGVAEAPYVVRLCAAIEAESASRF